MSIRWSDLTARARVVVALVAAIVLVGGLTVVAAVGADGDSDAVTTAGASTTATSTPTTSSPVPDVVAVTDPTTGITTIVVPGTTAPSTGATDPARATTTTAKSPTATAPTTTTPKAVTTTQPPAPATCTATSTNAAADELAANYCSYRARNGLAPMKRTRGLDAMAQEWAQHMADANKLEHRHPDAVRAGVTGACSSCVRWAENIAYNPTADASWRAWLNSSSHKANIDRNIAGEFGMGAAYANGFWWVVQNFGHYA